MKLYNDQVKHVLIPRLRKRLYFRICGDIHAELWNTMLSIVTHTLAMRRAVSHELELH